MDKILDTLKEGEFISLTRVLTALGYVTFLGLSLYLGISGKTWGNYGEFAFATGGAILVQLGNKYVNSKYNTTQGELGKKTNVCK